MHISIDLAFSEVPARTKVGPQSGEDIHCLTLCIASPVIEIEAHSRVNIDRLSLCRICAGMMKYRVEGSR